MSIAAAVLALQLAAAPALSAPAIPLSPAEQRYVAARDAQLARFAKADLSDERVGQEQRRARAELERQLRAIVGAVRVTGITGPGRINLEGLAPGEGAGMPDGLRFDWRGDTLFVGTRGLVDRYLAAARARGTPPSDMALAADALISDAGFMEYLEVPVRRGAGMDRAGAWLGIATQAVVNDPPSLLLVHVARGARVYLVAAPLRPAVAPIAACQAIMARDPNAYEPFVRCYAEALPRGAEFRALIRRAQAIVDAIEADPGAGPAGR
jgi:hypothetical protein